MLEAVEMSSNCFKIGEKASLSTYHCFYAKTVFSRHNPFRREFLIYLFKLQYIYASIDTELGSIVA